MKKFKFAIRNLVLARNILVPLEFCGGDFSFNTCKNSEDLNAVENLQAHLRGGRSFDFARRILFRVHGCRLIYVVKSESNEVVGYQMFYFGDDCDHGRKIHSAFTGIRTDFRGKRLATGLREYATANLRLSGIEFVTMDILASNTASRISAKNAGYQELEHAESVKSLKLINKL